MNITWQEGDLNYDGQVTISDFIDLASNFNTSYSGDILPIGSEGNAGDMTGLSSIAFVPESRITFTFCLAAVASSRCTRKRYSTKGPY